MQWNIENKKKAIDFILEEISKGNSLISIIRDKPRTQVPSRSIFYEWLAEDEVLSDKYARACEDRQELLFEEILDIADDSSHDELISEKGICFNTEFAGRSKIRIDARKWALSKMNPKKYGDKLQVEQDVKQITEILLTDATIDTNA